MPLPSPHQASLTDETFFEFVRKHRFVVIHFWASWNALDHMMQGLLDSKLPEDVRKLVALASFEIDPPAHRTICEQHNPRNVPYLAFYRDGILIQTLTGMQPPEVVVERVRELTSGFGRDK